MRDGNRAPKGKIYAKYHNVIRTLKNGGLIEATKKHKLSKYDENSNVRHLRNFGKYFVVLKFVFIFLTNNIL